MDRQAPAAQTISSPSAAQESTDQLPSTSSQSTERPSASGQLMSIAGQQIITNYIDRPPANWKISQIDRQVLKMVAKGNHALRIVEEPSFRELIELKAIVEYFHRSAHAQAKLKETQKQLNMQALKLKNDVVTR
ncbi:hypothetical protein ACLKA6_002660 [Drosophila palustris]